MKIFQYIMMILAVGFMYSIAWFNTPELEIVETVTPIITIEFSTPEVTVVKQKVIIKIKPKFIPKAKLTRSEFVDMVTSCYNEINPTLKLKLPIEIVIAQSGLESGWGTSRFALEGNNLFGVREFNLSKPHLKAIGSPNAEWGVKVYDSYCGSVKHYMVLLSSSGIYGKFQNELRYQYSVVTNGNYNWTAMVTSYASIYAEDIDYANKVVSTINRLIKLNLI